MPAHRADTEGLQKILTAGKRRSRWRRVVVAIVVIVAAIAAKNNADLGAALLEERRAGVDVTAEEGLRPFVLGLDGGYTHSSSPTVNQDGDVDFRTGNQLGIGGQVSKSTAVGTEASVRVEGSSDIASPDNSYGLAATLSVTQPILRGAGREVGEASLRQARNAQTLGVGQVSPAFEQFGQGAAYAGYVGLVYELPLSDTRKEAQRASARLDVDIAKQRLVATGDQVRSDVAVAIEKCASGRKKLALAEQTLAVSRKLAEAERERYALGASIFIQVRDAEEAEREAALRTVRARIDLVMAQIELDHLTGTLLVRLGTLPSTRG